MRVFKNFATMIKERFRTIVPNRCKNSLEQLRLCINMSLAQHGTITNFSRPRIWNRVDRTSLVTSPLRISFIGQNRALLKEKYSWSWCVYVYICINLYNVNCTKCRIRFIIKMQYWSPSPILNVTGANGNHTKMN